VQNGILKTLKEKLSKEDCAIVMKQQDESGNNLVAFNVSNGDSGLKTDIMEILQGLHLDDYAEIMSQKNNFGRNLAMLVFQKNCKEMEEKTVESLEILQKSRRKVFMEILTHKDDNNERLIDFLWTHKSDNVKSAILKLYNSNNIPIVE
jgi:ABC-type metal ion transport system substrate-binding protein